jgi:phage terminase Nu1 subunit (DNA packaging protein)
MTLIEVYNKALKTKSKRFPFRNSEDKLYAIETEYLTFVLETLEKTDHNVLEKKAEEYKKIEKKLTKEEFDKEKEKLIEGLKSNEKSYNEI